MANREAYTERASIATDWGIMRLEGEAKMRRRTIASIVVTLLRRFARRDRGLAS